MDVIDERKTSIYCLNDPRDGRLRYVGKADNPVKRWHSHIQTAGTNDHRGHWISELIALGLKPELEILEEVPYSQWPEIEMEYVRVFRMVGMNLVNTGAGGRGGTGRSPSAETREKNRIGSTNPSAETRAKRIAAMTGQKRSPEARARMSAAMRGIPKSAEHCAKIRAGKLGTHPSDETRVKMGIARLGNKNRLGHPHSDETRAKMSASHRRRLRKS